MTFGNGIKAGYWLINDATDLPVENLNFNCLICGFLPPEQTEPGIHLTAKHRTLLQTSVQKCHSNNIKVMCSFGGPGSGQQLSQMASSQQSRQQFVDLVIRIVRECDLDGVDLAWEYPTITAYDMSNLGVLLEELHTAIKKNFKRKVLLSAAVYYKPVIIVGGSPMKYPAYAINKYLDFVNVICYDYCVAENCPVTCDDSPLFDNITSRSISTNEGISEWIFAGVNPGKLVLGIPLDGKKWQLKDPSKTEIGSPATYEGPIRYKDIPPPDNVVYLQIVTQYCYAGDTWITYDGTQTVPVKVKYAKENHLAGYFIYDIAADKNSEIAAIASEAWDGN